MNGAAKVPATAELRVLGSDAARAVGRFNPGGPSGYRAKSLSDGPIRPTRAEAERDEAAYWWRPDQGAYGGFKDD